MNNIIQCDIRVSKCDKKHFRTGRDGHRYMDFELLSSPNSKFGSDYMIVQRVSKEDRLKGIKGAILGNGKIVYSKDDEATPFDEEKSTLPE